MLSIIIPCYKESASIENTVNILKNFLNENKIEAEIVCVDDGSPDNTMEVLKSIPGIKAVGYKDNRGKGGAVTYGLSKATGDYFIYMDADLSTDLKAIPECLKLLNEGHSYVVGSRYDKESNIVIKQPFKRRFISFCSRIIIKIMFRFHLKETQCGFKGMNKEMRDLITSKAKMNGFSFDVEYLYILKLNNKDYVTLPVTWKDDATSTVIPMKSSIQVFKDLFKIKKNKKTYINN